MPLSGGSAPTRKRQDTGETAKSTRHTPALGVSRTVICRSTVAGSIGSVRDRVVPEIATVWLDPLNNCASLETFVVSVPPGHSERSHVTWPPDHGSTPGVVG